MTRQNVKGIARSQLKSSMTIPPPHIPFLDKASYPPRAGNAVRPLLGARAAFRRICDAVENARHSIWITVAFLSPDFEMPDGHGSLFDVIERAEQRGLDVRVIFWRPNAEAGDPPFTFAGTPQQRAELAARGLRFAARWDRAEGPYCQHQKSWLIDVGQETETAFIGGINLTSKAMPPEHRTDLIGFHDLYLEVRGPSATDVAHNFVQRWNESSERMSDDGSWGERGREDLAFPTATGRERGDTLLQVQRSIRAGRYSNGHPAPGGTRIDIAAGEHAILEQYQRAIDAARRTIYNENQAVPITAVSTHLKSALQRGVSVVVLVPADPEPYVRVARRSVDGSATFEVLAELGTYPEFALVGLAVPDARIGRRNVYIHSKVMLIDDAWTTIGSCNLHAFSLFGHCEMNGSFWNPAVVRELRCALLTEHLAVDTSDLDDRAALDLYRRIASDNRRKRDDGNVDWQGDVFSLDAARYAGD
jgi:phosphatidylserine/phosphatidylglycerophosphate/cardiolipin synthase-like enzyme